MNSIDFFDGEREFERTQWGEAHDDVQVNCTTVARWVLEIKGSGLTNGYPTKTAEKHKTLNVR